MKAHSVAICLSAIFLSVSIAVAQQGKEVEYKRQADGRAYAELAKAPAKERAKNNPLEKDPDAVAAGGKLFEQHCASCHGDTAQGSRRGPSLLESPVQTAPQGALFWVLTNGVVWHGMPVWSKLPEPQRWQIVSYIKSLGDSLKKSEGNQAQQPRQ
jgi:mono/diheme cytochrome c family protein